MQSDLICWGLWCFLSSSAWLLSKCYHNWCSVFSICFCCDISGVNLKSLDIQSRSMILVEAALPAKSDLLPTARVRVGVRPTFGPASNNDNLI